MSGTRFRNDHPRKSIFQSQQRIASYLKPSASNVHIAQLVSDREHDESDSKRGAKSEAKAHHASSAERESWKQRKSNVDTPKREDDNFKRRSSQSKDNDEQLKQKDQQLMQLKQNNEQLKQKDEELMQLKQKLRQKDEELKQKKKELMQKQLKQKDQELMQLKQNNEQLRQKDEELTQKNKELMQQLKQKDQELMQLKQNNVQLRQKDEQKNKELMEKDEQLKQKDMELKQKDDQLRQIIEQQKQNDEELQQKYEALNQRCEQLTSVNERLLTVEEDSYKYTNAFTSADDNSVLGISKRYRHIQHNMRASAIRASKSVYKIPPKRHFCDQIMAAYDTAKEILMEESSKYINKFLLTLQPKGDTWNQENIKTCMKIVNQTLTDSKISEDAIEKIYKKLQWCDTEQRKDDTKADPISKDVSEYYQNLAELTWQAVARPIPMVYGVEENVYCKDVHELKDGYSDDEGKEITYIYPVLYTSNQWPRQIAKEGRVELH